MSDRTAKFETLHRIDAVSVQGAMISIHVDGWITAVRGALIINGKPIVQATGRFEFEPPGVRVEKYDDVKAEWFGDRPPLIEWSEV